jgi:nicotinamide-nucleotide amidase
MKAEIITIGDEILIGQIIDTNSAWIAEQFNLNGIEIHEIISVHDNHEQIIEALTNSAKKADLVLMTGGLGPTKDDITKKALCTFLDTRLSFHEPTWQHIKKRFENRKVFLNKLNRNQALVPETCIVLPNEIGTAPGMWFEKNDTIFISVPGVPFEMKNITEKEILPRLKKYGKNRALLHKTVLTLGLPESKLAQKIEKWESSLPANIRLAYLPDPMSVRLRLSAYGREINLLKLQIESEINKLNELIPDYIFGYDNDTMADIIGKLLLEKENTLSIAESCTGGYISHLITSVPGCSKYYKGGITAYSNVIKQDMLGVETDILKKYGAVSEPVVRQMAENVKIKFRSDYAIATSGIAGPAGGTTDKPVGTVWIAVAGPKKTVSRKYIFGDNRERNIIRSSQTALQMLRRIIIL